MPSAAALVVAIRPAAPEPLAEAGPVSSYRPASGAHAGGRASGSSRYLLLTDGAQAADAAGAWLAELCRSDSRIEVTVLYVFEPHRQPALLEADLGYLEPVDVTVANESRLALARMRDLLSLPPWRLQEAVAVADLTTAVLAELRRKCYRGVVLGREPAIGWHAMLRPDPFRDLLRRLDCALIAVPARPAAAAPGEVSVKKPSPKLHARFSRP